MIRLALLDAAILLAFGAVVFFVILSGPDALPLP
jgi:hypothetical protein